MDKSPDQSTYFKKMVFGKIFSERNLTKRIMLLTETVSDKVGNFAEKREQLLEEYVESTKKWKISKIRKKEFSGILRTSSRYILKAYPLVVDTSRSLSAETPRNNSARNLQESRRKTESSPSKSFTLSNHGWPITVWFLNFGMKRNWTSSPNIGLELINNFTIIIVILSYLSNFKSGIYQTRSKKWFNHNPILKIKRNFMNPFLSKDKFVFLFNVRW